MTPSTNSDKPMGAMERIEALERWATFGDKVQDSGVDIRIEEATLSEDNAKFLLRAFRVMREIAIENSVTAYDGELAASSSEKEVDNAFEEAMKKADGTEEADKPICTCRGLPAGFIGAFCPTHNKADK